MNKQINTIHFDADKGLIKHVNKRLDKLPTFYDQITDVDVFLKLDNVGHQLKDKVAEIKVTIPQHRFFGKHQSKSFEESFDTAFKAVISQIKRQKEKYFVG